MQTAEQDAASEILRNRLTYQISERRSQTSDHRDLFELSYVVEYAFVGLWCKFLCQKVPKKHRGFCRVATWFPPFRLRIVSAA